MNIIEKLNIKPTEWFLGGDEFVCLESDVRELEEQRNEMLAVLIEVFSVTMDINAINITVMLSIIKLIRKADPKHRTWKEIKELLNE